MLKTAFLSDIHGNIDALNLVLKDIEKRNVDQIICLGDLVAKYFYPDQVVDAIKENCSVVVKGNCDDLVATNKKYKYARSKLGFKRIDYLDSLPRKRNIILNDIYINLFHATPSSIDTIFNPLFKQNEFTTYKNRTIDDYNKMFEGNFPQLSIVGHTHQNYMSIVENNKLKLKDELIITCNDKAIINVGSAGEHSYIALNQDNYETIIDNYLTYLILEQLNDNMLKANMIKVPYKETLKKVYLDMIKLQLYEEAPYSPNDTKRVEKSLKLMK